jgi:hypothetical protein
MEQIPIEIFLKANAYRRQVMEVIRNQPIHGISHPEAGGARWRHTRDLLK